MYVVKNSNGDTVLTGEDRKHILAQVILFFECTNFEVDFITNKINLLGEECSLEVIENE